MNNPVAFICSNSDILKLSIFSSNPQAVKDAINDPKAVRFLVGQLMKKTDGKADPQLANSLINEKLKTAKT